MLGFDGTRANQPAGLLFFYFTVLLFHVNRGYITNSISRMIDEIFDLQKSDFRKRSASISIHGVLEM
jgi:hypothetical protein